jgi:hypothetical protein
MNGYKIEYQYKDNEVVPHWDEASNIAYDNSDVSIELDETQVETVQEALEALKNEFDSIEAPNITIDSNGNWVVGSTSTNTSAHGTFKFGRSNDETTVPTVWKTTQTLPDQDNRFLWFRIDYTQNGVTKAGTPYILMKYQTGNDIVGSNVKIITDTAEPTNVPNTLYFFT